MTRAALVDMARSIVGHAKAGTMELADAPMAVPVESYTDEARFAAEKERIFRACRSCWRRRASFPNRAVTRRWTWRACPCC